MKIGPSWWLAWHMRVNWRVTRPLIPDTCTYAASNVALPSVSQNRRNHKKKWYYLWGSDKWHKHIIQRSTWFMHDVRHWRSNEGWNNGLCWWGCNLRLLMQGQGLMPAHSLLPWNSHCLCGKGLTKGPQQRRDLCFVFEYFWLENYHMPVLVLQQWNVLLWQWNYQCTTFR